MTWPIHKNPSKSDESIAPYNFVPLPEKVFLHPDKEDEVCKLHEKYYTENERRHTGRIDLTIKTEAPLYTRCAYAPALAAKGVIKEPGRQQFFHHGDPDVPFIPGSSLRGMIRSLVEIIGYGKMQWVKDRILFFRSMEGGTLNSEYVPNFVEIHKGVTDGTNGKHSGFKPKVQAGILRYKNQKYFVAPCEIARVERPLLPVNPYPPPQDRNPNAVPPWHLQHKQVIVQLEPVAKWQFHKAQYKPKEKKLIHPDLYLWYRKVISISFGNKPSSPGEVSGILVLSGNVQRKHMEFVFIPKSVSPLELKNDVVEILEDNDQLTGWQDNAFSKDYPNKNCRTADGHLRDGEPIFYLLDKHGKNIVSIGRAQMFRLPYTNSTQEFIPKELKGENGLDLSEAIFGTIKKNGKKSIKSRVSFEDAEWKNKGSTSPFFDSQNKGRMIPKILSSPKPTAFQHYLVQPDIQDKKHYNSKSGDTVIRGHKLYWQKSGVDNGKIYEMDSDVRIKQDETGVEQSYMENGVKMWRESTQHTIIRPVKKDVEFASRIHFENLSDIELGALLTVLQLPDTMRHTLGMGKPLGMGSVKITAMLQVSDRKKRYETFSCMSDEEKSTEDTQKIEKTAKETFRDEILKHDGVVNGLKDLWSIPRLGKLAVLLEWKNPPDATQTRYVGIGNDKDGNYNQWRKRKILPTPLKVFGIEEPVSGEAAAITQNNPLSSYFNPPGTKSPTPRFRVGKKVSATIISVRNMKVMVAVEDGSLLPFAKPYLFTHADGETIEVKIKSTSPDGMKITSVSL